MERLHCTACRETQTFPRHCGTAMHLENVDGQEMLVCWMGAGCGVQPLPQRGDRAMTIAP